MHKILKKYSIDEIAEKTHISPLILNKLFSHNFEKLDIIKIKGFVKILKNEYPDFDFSQLDEEIENFFNQNKLEKEEKEEIVEEKNNNFFIYFMVFILIGVIVFLIMYMQKQQNKKISINSQKVELNDSFIEINRSSAKIVEKNVTTQLQPLEKTPKKKIKKTIEINNTLAIVPVQKVWFRVYNLTDNSSKQFLTKNEIDLNGSKKLYIQFGHGMVKFFYHNKVVYPDSVKRVNIIVENGELNITNKSVRDFK